MAKLKPKCPMCRTIRAVDEMRRHPSYTSIDAVERKLADMRDYKDLHLMCDGHREPYVRRDIYTMIGHWLQRVRSNVGLEVSRAA
jgi:hypothetical protein